MNKNISKIGTFVIASVFLINTNVYAEQTYGVSVNVDKKPIDFGKYSTVPFIEDGTTYLPFRSIFEQFDGDIDTDNFAINKQIEFEYDWANVDYTLTIYQNESKLSMLIEEDNLVDLYGEYEQTTYWEIEDIDVPNINGRIFVPVRAVSELMGYTVKWTPETKTVDIYTAFNGLDVPENATVVKEYKNSEETAGTGHTYDKNGTNNGSDYLNRGVFTPDTYNFRTLQQNNEVILSYINLARNNAGVPELTLDQSLIEYAMLKAEDHRYNDYTYDEDGEEGQFPQITISPRYGTPTQWYNDINGKGNNLYEFYKKTGDVYFYKDIPMMCSKTWINSQYRDEILSSEYTKAGFGYYYDGNLVHYVLELMK